MTSVDFIMQLSTFVRPVTGQMWTMWMNSSACFL